MVYWPLPEQAKAVKGRTHHDSQRRKAALRLVKTPS
jgi:hypothetical protein